MRPRRGSGKSYWPDRCGSEEDIGLEGCNEMSDEGKEGDSASSHQTILKDCNHPARMGIRDGCCGSPVEVRNHKIPRKKWVGGVLRGEHALPSVAQPNAAEEVPEEAVVEVLERRSVPVCAQEFHLLRPWRSHDQVLLRLPLHFLV